MNTIFLWGFMASGKTYWSKRLAKDLNLEMTDIDREVERSTKLSVKDIFKQHGETFFRIEETRVLEDSLKKSNLVVSCGGGTPLFHNNFRKMNEKGLSIFVHEQWDKIIDRISFESSDRPLVDNDKNWRESLKNRYLERIRFYKKAHCFFNPDEDNYERLVSLIRNHYLGS